MSNNKKRSRRNWIYLAEFDGLRSIEKYLPVFIAAGSGKATDYAFKVIVEPYHGSIIYRVFFTLIN